MGVKPMKLERPSRYFNVKDITHKFNQQQRQQ